MAETCQADNREDYLKRLTQEISSFEETLLKIDKKFGLGNNPKHNQSKTGKTTEYFLLKTPSQRLADYEAFLRSCSNNVDSGKIASIDFSISDYRRQEFSSNVDEKAQRRDLKRRPVSYKKKHSGKRSRTEEMKETIDLMMESLNETRKTSCDK